MKYLICILTFLMMAASSVQAQSNYGSGRESKSNYATTEDFTVEVKSSNYGYEFDRRDTRIKTDLKNKIKKFLSHTNESRFKGNGKIRLHIIKRDGKYYVVEHEAPEKLLPL